MSDMIPLTCEVFGTNASYNLQDTTNIHQYYL
jgi:hypothetical protein